ncbi:MAG: hypothetical protein JWQ51_3172 [Tardiphaga sp.]|nr:hypothetical protein [Tardiphaga sp.]MDB5630832.1 hypothetical protein [Tardiphaga sp.]
MMHGAEPLKALIGASWSRTYRGGGVPEIKGLRR